VLVNPETVVRWHRAGFRLYWSLTSVAKGRVGRKKLSKEVWDLIFQIFAEHPNWGAPRIHGELLMLGFEVSERTISRWMKRVLRDRELVKRWRMFLENHQEAIAAMDFFTVPTITFGVLYRPLSFRCHGHANSPFSIRQLSYQAPRTRIEGLSDERSLEPPLSSTCANPDYHGSRTRASQAEQLAVTEPIARGATDVYRTNLRSA
jgi:hypothetical protein